MPRDALPSVHNIITCTEHCVQRTLPIRTVFFGDIIIRWTRGGGGGGRNMDVNLKFHVSNTFLCLHAFGNVGGC